MLRIVLLGTAGVGAFVAGRKAFLHVKPSGNGGSNSPMDIVARGSSCFQSSIGPIEPQDMAIGLAAISKVTEKQPPEPVGQLAEKLSQDPHFLMEAQHWRAHCEAIYSGEPAAWSLLTHLPENAIVTAQWTPDNDTMRPAYVVCVDPSYGAVVVAIRGTNDATDMILNAAMTPEDFEGGQAHAGFIHATEHLLKEIEPHLETALESLKGPDKRLVLTGHSLGCAVASLAGLKLREKFPTLRVWGLGPPACMSLNLAKRCSEFSNNLFAGHDLIPRFSLATVEKLRQRVLSFDWERADEICKGDEDWENIKQASSTLRQMGKTSDGVLEKVQQTGNKCQEVGGKAGQVKDAVSNALPIGEHKESEEDEKKKNTEEKDNKQNGSDQDSKSEKQNGDSTEEQKNGDKTEGDESGNKEPIKLYAPGNLLSIYCDPPACGKMPGNRPSVPQQRQFGAFPTFEEAKNGKWKLMKVDPESLNEIVISPWCISDHMPGAVNFGLDSLQRVAPPLVSTT